MPHALFVCLQDEDKIASYVMDADTGQLSVQGEAPATGGPSVLALSPDRRTLYLGHRTRPAISSFRIDLGTGGLTPLGSVSATHAPTFLAPDRTGRYLLSCYYQGGGVAVHHVASDGAVGAPSLDWLATATGAHAIATDPSNQFAFVPHIARLNDNVLEPPKENPGPNMIMQFRFDVQTGRLTANSPARVEPAERLGPRHYCFHPALGLVYFSNEQGCSVTGYRLDGATGTPLCSANHHEPARRVHRTEHLLPNSPDAVGAIPLCGQSRPQQHRRVRCRRHRAFDRRRACVHRSGPQRLRARPRRPFPLRRRHGIGPTGIVPHQ